MCSARFCFSSPPFHRPSTYKLVLEISLAFFVSLWYNRKEGGRRQVPPVFLRCEKSCLVYRSSRAFILSCASCKSLQLLMISRIIFKKVSISYSLTGFIVFSFLTLAVLLVKRFGFPLALGFRFSALSLTVILVYHFFFALSINFATFCSIAQNKSSVFMQNS